MTLLLGSSFLSVNDFYPSRQVRVVHIDGIHIVPRINLELDCRPVVREDLSRHMPAVLLAFSR